MGRGDLLLAQAMTNAGGAPSQAQVMELKGLQAKVPGYYRQLTTLMILAVVTMALYRVV